MSGAEGMRRSDWVRLAIWLVLWSAGFWMLQYGHFHHHNLYGVLAYLAGVIALCDKRRTDEDPAQGPQA